MVDFARLGQKRVLFAPKPELQLNEEQQAAINFVLGGAGSLNLISCAGTGKTTTLIHMLKYMEGDAFFGAFNKSIAEEIQARVSRMPGISAEVRVSTLHSAGAAACFRAFSTRKPQVNSGKVRGLVDQLAARKPLVARYGGTIVRLISMAKQAGVGVRSMQYKSVHDTDMWDSLRYHFAISNDASEDAWEILYEYAADIYETSLRACRDVIAPFDTPVIDFDDMLLAPLFYGVRFYPQDHVLLDEAQDSNAVRREMCYRMLKPGTGRLYAVGDPNQAIYGFTGADNKAMDLIAARLGSTTLKLTTTYRCTKAIVRLAQQWVPDIKAREDAPEGEEPRNVWLYPIRTRGQASFWEERLETKDIILCRNIKPMVELAMEFIKRRIEVQIADKDMGDELAKLVLMFRTDSLDSMLLQVTAWGAQQHAKFKQAHRDMKAQDVLDKVGTISDLTSITKMVKGATANVSALIDITHNLFVDVDPGNQRCITMSTIHKAKGKEWERVYILGRERYMPSKFAIQPHELEQERNLCYVAVTRARTELVDIVLPKETTKDKKRRVE